MKPLFLPIIVILYLFCLENFACSCSLPDFCEITPPPLKPLPDHHSEVCCGYNFTLVKQPDNWMSSHLHCRSYGMQLASIETKGKYDCLLQVIQNSAKSGPDNFWTAGNDILREGDFTWISSGTRVGTFYNAPGQPDNGGGNENCVSLRKDFPNSVGSKYVMNDENCDLKFLFICEHKYEQPPSELTYV